ncbi:MAG TPA: type VI secretion system lipoprotein TssJ [Xanthomonadaceae bacterium]|nr:type VI secretion system lipoprotein TssJ [Xanthomonadaceae bacterium]
MPGTRLRIARAAALLFVISITLCGCASGGLRGGIDKTLQAVGLREAKPAEPPTIQLRLFAGSNLNSGTDNRPTAAIVKIYHLRSAQRFEKAPFNAFLDQAGEQAALGADALSVNEIVLMPGTRQNLDEKLSAGTGAIGVVALFRAPAEIRWRLAFDANAKQLPLDGITIGVHACALTTADSAALLTQLSGDPASLASVRCTK